MYGIEILKASGSSGAARQKPDETYFFRKSIERKKGIERFQENIGNSRN